MDREQKHLAELRAILNQRDAALERRFAAAAEGIEAMRASDDETVCDEVEAELDRVGKITEEQALLHARSSQRMQQQADEVNRTVQSYLTRLARISSPCLRARGRSRRPAKRVSRSASSRRAQTDSGGARDGDGDGDGDPPGRVAPRRSPPWRRNYRA